MDATTISAALDAAELALSQGDSHAARQHIAAARAAGELKVNLRIDPSPECLKRLCDGLVAAVKPNGGYRAATSDDTFFGDTGNQMVQVEWWIQEYGCDSLENTLDAIKGRLLAAVRNWWSTAMVSTTRAADAGISDQALQAEFVAWFKRESLGVPPTPLITAWAVDWARHLLSGGRHAT